MLSIGAMSGGQENYYLELAREDYYLEGGEPPGRWLGRGARALGLSGDVQAAQLQDLFAGRRPGGAALVQNAGDRRRQPGWDFTFSAPKSVSVIWSLGDPNTRARIQAAHAQAVAKALAYLEDSAAFTRRGKNGQAREPAGLVVATFEHGTSRAQDPQLHTHCLVLNCGTRPDGTTGTIESRPLYRHKMAAGALYRAELAHLLGQLGLTARREKTWFEVEGVPQALVEEFSKRRREVVAALASRCVDNAAAAAVAALTTRRVKEHVARDELFTAWRATGAAYGFTPEQVRGLFGNPPQREAVPGADPLVHAAAEKITQRQSHFSRADLVRRTAEEAQGRGLGADAVRRAVQRHLADERGFVRLGRVGGEERFTTREVLALEKQLLARVEASRSDTSHVLAARTVQVVLGRHPGLNREQAAALAHITRAPGAVQVVNGLAGTGKTSLLRAAREAWEREGYAVLGAALSGKAARGLEKGSGIPSTTITRLIGSEQLGFVGELGRSRAGAGPPGAPDQRRPDRATLNKDTVLVVDEAGMVGTRQLERLTREVCIAGAKLVLVGDDRQLQAVEAGCPFRSIGERLGQAELTHISRQRQAWARRAIRSFACGDAPSALEAFAERGLLYVAEDRAGAMNELIAAWRREGAVNPQDHLIFTGLNLEAVVLNRLAQQERKLLGALGSERVWVGAEPIHVGDRVLFTRNSATLGVRNGDLGTVRAADPAAGRAAVQLDQDRLVHVPLAYYDFLRLGYAITTHKGQGATVENAYILAGGAIQDREISYVQASRARGETRIFTDRLEAGEALELLSRQMSRTRAKQLAHDVLEQPCLQPRQPALAR